MIWTTKITRNSAFTMIVILLLLIVLVSPTLLILWSAIDRVGLAWSLLLIPAGAIAGAVLMGVGGTCIPEFMFWLDDRRTGPPAAGSIGAWTGRAIIDLIFMMVFGWIGSGFGAWIASHWIG